MIFSSHHSRWPSIFIVLVVLQERDGISCSVDEHTQSLPASVVSSLFVGALGMCQRWQGFEDHPLMSQTLATTSLPLVCIQTFSREKNVLVMHYFYFKLEQKRVTSLILSSETLL